MQATIKLCVCAFVVIGWTAIQGFLSSFILEMLLHIKPEMSTNCQQPETINQYLAGNLADGNLYSSLIVNSHSDPGHFPHLPYSLRCRVSFFHVLHYSSIYVKLQLCSDRNLSLSISRTFLSYTDQDKRLKFQYVLLKSIWVFFSILNLKIHLIQLIKWQEKTLKSKKKRFQQGLNSQPTDDQSTIITNTLKSQLLERHTEKPWSSLQSCLTDSS